jgi:glycosyltransferase involved in cell wall biosynthesis
MNVLFLMFAFPDMDKSFNMYTSLVDMFNKNGHSVTVIAPGTDIKKSRLTSENGIEVLRVKTFSIKNVSNLRKGVANLLLPFQYHRAINKYYKNRKFDVILIPTPPITLGSLAEILKKKHNARIYLILRDIFPQNAVDLGFIKRGSLLHNFFKRKERNLYNIADSIGCMSPANISYIKKENPQVSLKLHVLRNWQYLNNQENTDIGHIKKKYNLTNKFAVVFGGNMGKPQQLENVIELAFRCKHHSDIIFVLLGEGVMMDKIRKEVQLKELDNIRIHGSIPKMEYQYLLKACEVGLISLNENFTIPNIPSKALDYWNVGLPILSSLDRATDFGQITDETRTGLWSYAGEHRKLYENLMKLYLNADLRKEMSENGRLYFKKYLQPEIAYKTIIENV